MEKFDYPTDKELFIKRLLYLSKQIRFFDTLEYTMVWIRTMKDAQNWNAEELNKILKENFISQVVTDHIFKVRDSAYLEAVSVKTQKFEKEVKELIETKIQIIGRYSKLASKTVKKVNRDQDTDQMVLLDTQ